MKTLILGGVRSGKSRLAEALALQSGLPVTFIATALPGDEEMRERIEAHRRRRPPGWQVVEEPYALAGALRTHAAPGRCVIVDCLTLWLTQLLCAGEERLARERDALIEVLPPLEAETLLVSNETGLGIVPLEGLSRRFHDEAGRLHQALAGHCERVLFTVEVIDLGVVNDTGPLAGVIDCRLGPGTANFTRAPAMSPEQCARALEAGRQATERARINGAQLFIGGDMGIGNTTAAAALACALFGLPPEPLTGPGTGLDSIGVAHKVEVIRRALALHRANVADPLQALRRLGGFEIAALAGSYLTCAQLGVPVLVDGFIASVAALVAARLGPGAGAWFLFAHASAEPGHRRVLDALNGQPLLDLDLRLGEGSGAAVAVPLIRLACALHRKMATFAEADVSGKVR